MGSFGWYRCNSLLVILDFVGAIKSWGKCEKAHGSKVLFILL
ncbi:hypothetical protein HMPREF9352_1299 [Streptococcus gallolyticus subsp. gallolyticus TX20005]|nr:hypothetical protein HMPREF9352_1299 [Streptococcus gallolyticus subsp. gallolyticus TX20005]